MKRITKNIVGAAVAAVLSFGLISFSCSGKGGAANGANTAFADTVPAVKIPAESLSVLEAMQNVFRSISSQVLPSVVEVDVTEKKTRPANPFGDWPFKFFGMPEGGDEPREYEAQGLGSGVIIRKDGKKYYVLTNNHVAGSATEISVKLNDGRKFDGKLVGADERMDVALVSFESDDSSIPCATLGDSDKVQTGDICFAMGAPLGYSQSVTEGIVSATGRSGGQIGNINDFIQTDTAINQGNSGGPLLNIYGEVIGINTWIASQSGGSQGLGFAIPINNIKNAIDAFIADGKVTYGWLGVSLVEIHDDVKESLGVKGKDGAFASQIFVDSPAFKGGMQAGDYITELNGRPVKSVDQLVRDVGSLPAKKEAKFKVVRGGKEMALNVMITERTKEVASSTKLWPGFIPVPLTEDVRKKLELDNKVEGVAVTNVQAKSPAASLRLQEGDVITAVNGKKVKNLAEFYAALDLTKTKSIQFTIGSGAGSITTGTYNF